MGEGKTEEGRRKGSRMEERAEENEGGEAAREKKGKEGKKAGWEQGGKEEREERTGALGPEGGKREPWGRGSV